MIKTLTLAIAVAGLALASSKTYRIDLSQAAQLGDMELAPGSYKVTVVDDQKAIITNGKMHGEAPVKVETAPTKASSTRLRFNIANGKTKLDAIFIGGSTTELVFAE